MISAIAGNHAFTCAKQGFPTRSRHPMIFKYHGLYRYRVTFSDTYNFQAFDLGLLVNDIEEAVTILKGAGYFRTHLSSAERRGWAIILTMAGVEFACSILVR